MSFKILMVYLENKKSIYLQLLTILKVDCVREQRVEKLFFIHYA